MRDFLILTFQIGLIFFLGCFKVNYEKKQNNTSVAQEKSDNNHLNSSATSYQLKDFSNQQSKDQLKALAEEFRFLSNVERETMRALRPQFSISMLPFEVISTILDQNVGIKKNFARIDCRLYQIKWISDEHLQIEKQCQKPFSIIVDIKNIKNKNKEVIFYTREWANLLGNTVALTAPNRICQYTVAEEKIKSFQCEKTVFGLAETTDVQELRLDQWLYQAEPKTARYQLEVSGGIYKDLVEHRKIKMIIPFEGKIKVTEKALKVRDDFAPLLEQTSEPMPGKSDAVINQNTSHQNPQENPNGREKEKKQQEVYNPEAQGIQQGVPPLSQSSEQGKEQSKEQNNEQKDNQQIQQQNSTPALQENGQGR